MVDLKNKDSTRDLFSYEKYTHSILKRERKHIFHAQRSSEPPQYNIQDWFLCLVPYNSRQQLPGLEGFVILILLCFHVPFSPRPSGFQKNILTRCLCHSQTTRYWRQFFLLHLVANLHILAPKHHLEFTDCLSYDLLPEPKIPSQNKQW